MLGGIRGANQSKVLTNSFSELLIALLFLVLASLLKPGGGKARWGFLTQAKLHCLPELPGAEMQLRSPRESPNSPGELLAHQSGEVLVWHPGIRKENAEMGYVRAYELHVNTSRGMLAHSAPWC